MATAEPTAGAATAAALTAPSFAARSSTAARSACRSKRQACHFTMLLSRAQTTLCACCLVNDPVGHVSMPTAIPHLAAQPVRHHRHLAPHRRHVRRRPVHRLHQRAAVHEAVGAHRKGGSSRRSIAACGCGGADARLQQRVQLRPDM